MSARPRVISATDTGLVKFGGTVLWVADVIGVTVGGIRYARAHEQMPVEVLAGGVLSVAVLAWVAWQSARLMRVALTDDALLVSNFRRREVVVALRDVERVRQPFWSDGRVLIDLARDTDFGRRIAFLPKRRERWLFRMHPVVERLRDAIADARARERMGV